VNSWCNNGFYCCGTNQCCPIGPVPTTGGGGPLNTAPIGSDDTATCTSISGWSFDQDTPTTSIPVHLYANGPAGKGAWLGSYPTNVSRPDVNTAYGITGTHGFSITTPVGLKDGANHSIYVYGVDSTSYVESLLSGSPKTINCPTPTLTPTPTTAPRPWIRLRDTSFISDYLYNEIPVSPSAYDTDDTTEPYFIVGNAGIVAAPIVTLTSLNPGAKTGNPEYKVIYTSDPPAFTPQSFLYYVKSRKRSTVIVGDLSEITASGIYIYEINSGNVTINSNLVPFNQTPGYNIVLIATGTVTINAAPDGTFTPTGSVAILAPNIVFSPSITQAKGIFIASKIDPGVTANQGLKIVGNLIAQTLLSDGRNWSDLNKPVIFVKFDQNQYIDLLPYLSTAKYTWGEEQ
jgi:hypothetical protein